MNDGYNINIKDFPNKKLCEIIISSRYLGILQKEAILCMNELADRRNKGDNFDYETFIDAEIVKLPQFNINIRKKMQIAGLDLSVLKGIK